MTESVLPIPLNCLGTRDQINTLREKGEHANIASLPVDNPTTSFWQTEALDESFTLNDDKISREWDNDAGALECAYEWGNDAGMMEWEYE